MNKNEMIKKIAHLESVNDQLLSEIEYLDKLSKSLGFEKGLESLKSAAQELLDEMSNQEDNNQPPMAG